MISTGHLEPMVRPSRIFSGTVGVVPFLLLLALVPGFCLASDTPISSPPIFVQLQGRPAGEPTTPPIRLSLIDTRYEVDIFGSLALGKLVQEFRNDAGQDLSVEYRFRGIPGLTAESLDFEVDGRAPEFQAEKKEPEAEKKEAKPFPIRQLEERKDKKSGVFQVEADQRVMVRANFRQILPMEGELFHFSLPPVSLLSLQEPVPARPRTPGRVQRGEKDLDSRTPDVATTVPLSVGVNIFHDEPLTRLESDSHEIFSSYEGDLTRVTLAGGRSQEPTDFRLKFGLGSEREPRLHVYAGPEQGDTRDLILVFAPPSDPWEGLARPKQVLFVLDSSGSMTNHKLDRARLALAHCLEKLGPDDLYNIIEFHRDFTQLSEETVGQLQLPPDQARIWLDGLEAKGETRLLPALSAAFQQLDSEDHHRMVVIITDGIVADEKRVLQFLEEKLGEARLFVLGIGMDVREETITAMADFGRGRSSIARQPEAIRPALSGLFQSVALPLVWDLAFDWSEVSLESIRPERLPDLYAGRTVTALARIKGYLPNEILLSGVTVDGEQTWVGPVKFMGEEAGLRDLPLLRGEAPAAAERGRRKPAKP